MDIRLLERKQIAASYGSENVVGVSSNYVAISSGSAIAVSALDVTKKEVCGEE